MAQAVTNVPRFDVASWEATAQTAQRIAEQGYQLIGLRPDGRVVIAEDFAQLPDEDVREVTNGQLNDGAALAESARYARRQELTLAGWDRLMREAKYAHMLPAVRRLRERVAKKTKSEEHDIAVFVEWSATEPRAERVVMRLPEDCDLEAVGSRIPGWSTGWSIEDDAWAGLTTFTWGQKRVLPTAVPLTAMPTNYDPARWDRPAYGLDEDGQLVRQDLSGKIHTLVAGESGSGKTVTINALLTARLLAGHQVVIIDPTKGLDFPAFKDYALCIAEDYETARAVMRWLLQENERRRVVLKKHDAQKLAHLPAEVREAENFYPLTVVGDELAELLVKREVTPDLDKADPLRIEQELEKSAVALIDAGFRKLSAVGRSQGISLILATQQARRESFGSGGTTVRTNLGNSIYLHAPSAGVNRDNVKFLFDTKAEAAIELLEVFDEGLHGLAITMGEVGAPSALRVAKAEAKDVTPVLEAAGVPKATPLDFSTVAVPTEPARATHAEPVDPWA